MFAICAAISACAAAAVMVFSVPQYSRVQTLLINPSIDSDGNMNINSTLGSMGAITSFTSFADEVMVFDSYNLICNAIKDIEADKEYWLEEFGHDKLLFGNSRPLKVNLLDCDDEHSAGFRIETGDMLTLSSFQGDSLKTRITASYGDTVQTPSGRIVILRDGKETMTHGTIRFRKPRMYEAFDAFHNRFSVTQEDKLSYVLTMTVTDPSPERAEAFLNAVIQQYYWMRVFFRNENIGMTTDAVTSRLSIVERELDSLDLEIARIQSDCMYTDSRSYEKTFIEESHNIISKMNEYAVDLQQAKLAKKWIDEQNSPDNIIPLSIAMDNPSVTKLIQDCNDLILKRQSLSAASGNNIMIKELEEDIKLCRQNIREALDMNILSFESKIRSLEHKQHSVERKYSTDTGQWPELIGLERKRFVAQKIYMYLLVTREENNIASRYGESNIRILQRPEGPANPVFPSLLYVLSLALLAGLGGPALFIWQKIRTNTLVQSAEELKALDIPVAGMISKRKKADGYIAVTADGTDKLNNEFRSLRTNLDFLKDEGKAFVIMCTSFIPGSGKTFISSNLARAMALNGSKTILVDCDLRKATASSLCGSPDKGISNLIHDGLSPKDGIILKDTEISGLDYLPCGSIPPDPVELLSSERFSKTIDSLREEYDYILLDCPPTEAMADCSEICKSSDITLFTVRINHLDRGWLPGLREMYEEQRYGRMYLTINAEETL